MKQINQNRISPMQILPMDKLINGFLCSKTDRIMNAWLEWYIPPTQSSTIFILFY